MSGFLDELRRRHVVRVTVVYVAVAFAVLQAADLAFPRLGLPDWAVTLVLVLALLGLPLALVLAWAFDLTPAGVRRTAPVPAAPEYAAPPDAPEPTSSAAVPTTAAPGAASTDRQDPASTPRFAAVVPIIVVALAVTAGIAMRQMSLPVNEPRPVLRFDVPLSDDLEVGLIHLAPDGSRLFVQTTRGLVAYGFADMKTSPVELPGVGAWASLSVSPDGASIAFILRGALRVAPLSGGTMRTLVDSARTTKWGDDQRLYVVTRRNAEHRVQRMAADGTGIEDVAVFDEPGTVAVSIVTLPGGRGLLYHTERADGEPPAVGVIDARTSQRRPLAELSDGSTAVWYISYAPTGHLLFVASDGVYAIPFDARRLNVTGTRVRVLAGQPLSASYAAGMLAISDVPPIGPVLVDRHDVRTELPGALHPDAWGFEPAVAPRGDAIVYYNYHGEPHRWDVWLYALPAGPATRLSPDSFPANVRPGWARGGRDVHFLGSAAGSTGVYVVPANGSGTVERLFDVPAGVRGQLEGVHLLPDGRSAVLVSTGGGMMLAGLENGTLETLVEPRYNPGQAAVSRDGRWVAYVSAEAGGREVFVRALDGSPGRWQVSRNAGKRPVWSRSGRQLFLSAADSVYAVTFDGDADGVRTGPPKPLFSVDAALETGYDVLPGDSQFVFMNRAAGERGRITVIVNFDELLRRMEAGAGPGTAPAAAVRRR
jgi:hypothetical protein